MIIMVMIPPMPSSLPARYCKPSHSNPCSQSSGSPCSILGKVRASTRNVFRPRAVFAPMSRVMLHYLMDRTSASGGVILDRLKLKSRLRRLVRGGLGAALLIQVEAFGVGDLPVWG